MKKVETLLAQIKSKQIAMAVAASGEVVRVLFCGDSGSYEGRLD